MGKEAKNDQRPTASEHKENSLHSPARQKQHQLNAESLSLMPTVITFAQVGMFTAVSRNLYHDETIPESLREQIARILPAPTEDLVLLEGTDTENKEVIIKIPRSAFPQLYQLVIDKGW